MSTKRKSLYDLEVTELAADILLLLQLLREKRLHEAVVRQVVKGACWWVSNAKGKRDDCPIWSEAAFKMRADTPSWPALGLIHEHLVPRNFIEEQILGLEQPTVESIGALLELSVVCIVTNEEDTALREAGLRDKMTPEWKSGTDILARYRAVGIELRAGEGLSDAKR